MEPEWRTTAPLGKKDCGLACSSVFVQLLAHAGTAAAEREHRQAAEQRWWDCCSERLWSRKASFGCTFSFDVITAYF